MPGPVFAAKHSTYQFGQDIKANDNRNCQPSDYHRARERNRLYQTARCLAYPTDNAIREP